MEKSRNPINNNRNYMLGAAVLLILAAVFGWSFLANRNDNNSEDNQNKQATQSEQNNNQTPPPAGQDTQQNGFAEKKFEEKKTPHFVSSTPANNALLTTAPTSVSIKFDFNLGAGSTIEVVSEKGVDVVPSGPKISADLKTLSIPVSITRDGNYSVTYKACWPDGSCHDGSFGFNVDLK